MGGAFSAPPISSLKLVFFGSKNDNTILPYIFEDLAEGLEPMTPPQPPKKPTFVLFVNTENFTENW